MKKVNARVRLALQSYATRLMDADDTSVEEGKALDRALRETLGDIDPIWVRWGFEAEKRGWVTADELVMTKRGYQYPTQEET